MCVVTTSGEISDNIAWLGVSRFQLKYMAGLWQTNRDSFPG